MCHFITLIVPTNDLEAVRAVMKRHRRAATPLDNPSIRKVLRDEEHQYLTTPGHCDCGTVLAPRHDSPQAFEDKLAKDEARMRRKGWSEAKIARAIDDRRKADSRPSGDGADSLELWIAVLYDIKAELDLPYARLFVRFYSGAIDTESFTASRHDIAVDVSLEEALASLEHDEVTIFH